MSLDVQTCGIANLSIERAAKRVPPEFLEAWAWYSNKRNETFPRLPIGKDAPQGLNIKLARQAGIHSPDYSELPSKGNGCTKFVLSVHTGSNQYDDKDVLHRDDGTWILDYSAHRPGEGRKGTTDFNGILKNNLTHGVPVAVLTKQSKGGYFNYGLAFVEQYNSITDSFVLHGPVTPDTERVFSTFDASDNLSETEKKILSEWDDEEDTRIRVLAERVRRERQGAFRKKILDAYEGHCAVTDINILEVLQAAHIDPYRGRNSQIVTNGILLRADIHLLYDAHLLSIEPDSKRLRLSGRLKASKYKQYEGHIISIPTNIELRPSERLLGLHWKQFKALNH